MGGRYMDVKTEVRLGIMGETPMPRQARRESFSCSSLRSPREARAESSPSETEALHSKTSHCTE
jgi:hypothetical protein